VSERRPSFEERLRSGEGAVSWINEPIDFTVNFAIEQPKLETPTARALRIWFKLDVKEKGHEQR
jgi:hypothetical protein